MEHGGNGQWDLGKLQSNLPKYREVRLGESPGYTLFQTVPKKNSMVFQATSSPTIASETRVNEINLDCHVTRRLCGTNQ